MGGWQLMFHKETADDFKNLANVDIEKIITTMEDISRFDPVNDPSIKDCKVDNCKLINVADCKVIYEVNANAGSIVVLAIEPEYLN